MVLVSGAFLALLIFQQPFSFAGFLLRTWCQRSRLQKLAEELRDDWPNRDGRLPIVGKYQCDPSCPDVLILEVNDLCPLREQFGPLLRRRPDGSFCIDIVTRLSWKLDLLREGGLPESFDDGFPSGLGEIDAFGIHNRLERTIQLGRTTFVSKYTPSFQLEDCDDAARLVKMAKRALGTTQCYPEDRHGNANSGGSL
jgi:hypothetical protein